MVDTVGLLVAQRRILWSGLDGQEGGGGWKARETERRRLVSSSCLEVSG